MSFQVAVDKFLSRVGELELRDGLSQASILNLALLKRDLLTYRNGISSNTGTPTPNGFVFILLRIMLIVCSLLILFHNVSYCLHSRHS